MAQIIRRGKLHYKGNDDNDYVVIPKTESVLVTMADGKTVEETIANLKSLATGIRFEIEALDWESSTDYPELQEVTLLHDLSIELENFSISFYHQNEGVDLDFKIIDLNNITIYSDITTDITVAIKQCVETNVELPQDLLDKVNANTEAIKTKANTSHKHNVADIEDLVIPEVDLSNYYNKEETYSKEEVDLMSPPKDFGEFLVNGSSVKPPKGYSGEDFAIYTSLSVSTLRYFIVDPYRSGGLYGKMAMVNESSHDFSSETITTSSEYIATESEMNSSGMNTVKQLGSTQAMVNKLKTLGFGNVESLDVNNYDKLYNQQILKANNINMSKLLGKAGQLVYNTDTKTIHTMDGTTPGGTPLAKKSDIIETDLSDYYNKEEVDNLIEEKGFDTNWGMTNSIVGEATSTSLEYNIPEDWKYSNCFSPYGEHFYQFRCDANEEYVDIVSLKDASIKTVQIPSALKMANGVETGVYTPVLIRNGRYLYLCGGGRSSRHANLLQYDIDKDQFEMKIRMRMSRENKCVFTKDNRIGIIGNFNNNHYWGIYLTNSDMSAWEFQFTLPSIASDDRLNVPTSIIDCSNEIYYISNGNLRTVNFADKTIDIVATSGVVENYYHSPLIGKTSETELIYKDRDGMKKWDLKTSVKSTLYLEENTSTETAISFYANKYYIATHSIDNGIAIKELVGTAINPKIEVSNIKSNNRDIIHYAGIEGQIVANTETNRLHLMDGVTNGGTIIPNMEDVHEVGAPKDFGEYRHDTNVVIQPNGKDSALKYVVFKNSIGSCISYDVRDIDTTDFKMTEFWLNYNEDNELDFSSAQKRTLQGTIMKNSLSKLLTNSKSFFDEFITNGYSVETSSDFKSLPYEQQQARATDANLANYTGKNGQVVVNTTNKSLHVMDGETPGGTELAKKSEAFEKDWGELHMAWMEGFVPPADYDHSKSHIILRQSINTHVFLFEGNIRQIHDWVNNKDTIGGDKKWAMDSRDLDFSSVVGEASSWGVCFEFMSYEVLWCDKESALKDIQNHLSKFKETKTFLGGATNVIEVSNVTGTNSDMELYAGVEGQVVVNTDDNSIHVMDGVKAGGHKIKTSIEKPLLTGINLMEASNEVELVFNNSTTRNFKFVETDGELTKIIDKNNNIEILINKR